MISEIVVEICRIGTTSCFLFKHFVAHSTSEIVYRQKHDTKDILQVIKRWYSTTTYITPIRK